MLIKSRVVLGSAIALLALTACNNSKDTDQTKPAATATIDGPAAATVNGTPISQKEVDLILKQQAQQGMQDTPETRKMIIDNLAVQLLVAQEGIKKGLDKTPEIATQIEMTKESILANAFVQDYIKNNPISDTALAAEYDKLKAQVTGNQYKARHILVKTEDEAKDIIAKLNKDPKAFDALAKAKSQDPGSKDKGGDLGWFDPHGMVPEFGAAVGKLEKGKFTETPVKTQYGYHVILLEDTRPNPVPPLEQVKAQISQQAQQQNLKKLIDDLKAKARIDIVATSASATAVTAAPASSAAAPK